MSYLRASVTGSNNSLFHRNPHDFLYDPDVSIAVRLSKYLVLGVRYP